MAHELTAIKSYIAHEVLIAEKGKNYRVWVTPNGYGKWQVCIGELKPTPKTDFYEQVNRGVAEWIFGTETMKKYFGNLLYSDLFKPVFKAKTHRKDEEDIL